MGCHHTERNERFLARTEKACCVCHQTLPLCEFNKDNQRTGRISSRCKRCAASLSAKQRERIIAEAAKRAIERAERRVLEAELVEEKLCLKCRVVKPVAEFWKTKLNLYGLTTWCKPCLRAYDHKRKFGLTPELLQSTLTSQGNCCAICRAPFTGPRSRAIDHCHGSRECRGLLCPRCNAGLGFFLDSPERLRAAAVYIEKWLERRATSAA
jgi:hypothetical protein